MVPPSPSGHPHHPILGCLPEVTQPWEPRQEMGAFRQKPEQMQLITCSQMTRGEGRVGPGRWDGGRGRPGAAGEPGPVSFPCDLRAVPLTAGEGLTGLSAGVS